MTTARATCIALFLCCLPSIELIAQQSSVPAFNQQLTFTCDNNFLLFNGDDGYYTSGLFLRYDRLRARTSAKTLKQVFSYELGHRIYTAHSRKILPNPTPQIPGGLDEIDRPIAGHLYAKASMSTAFKNNSLLNLGLSVGTIGSNSFGEELYAFWHRVIGVKEYWNWVWDYQVEDKLGVNLHGSFASALLNHTGYWQITPATEVTLGTSFINITQALVVQYGKQLHIGNSSYWNTRLQPLADAPSNKQELFVYYKPALSYQVYNATLEGGRFTKEQSGIIAEPEPWVVAHTFGLCFATQRYAIAYHVTLQSKEAKHQFNNHAYASLTVTYRFSGAAPK